MLRKTWQFRELLYVLVRRDLLVRYQSSIFGFLWSFAQPLSMVLIFGVAFSIILRFETDGSNVPFGLHILVGILAWTLFQNSISEGHGSILGHANLIKKVKMPVMIFPLVTVIGNLINFMLGMLVVFPIILIKMSGSQGIVWTQAILQIVLFLAVTALLLLFTLSLTLIVSAVNVYFRDMASLTGVTMLAWFYATPIVYPLTLVMKDGQFRFGADYAKYIEMLYLLNPLATICLAYRRILLYREPHLEIPDSSLLIYIGCTFGITLVIFVIAMSVFRRCARGFADEV